MIRGSEAHKSFAAFLSSAVVRGQFNTVPERARSFLAGTSAAGPNDRTGFSTGGTPYGLTGLHAGCHGTGGASFGSTGVWADRAGSTCGAGMARGACEAGWDGVNVSMGPTV